MEGIGIVHAKLFGRNEHCAGSSQTDIASTLAHNACTNCRSRIVACTSANFDSSGNTQLNCNIRIDSADAVIAFKELRHLSLRYLTDIQHLLAPAFVLHVQKQHAGSIGVIAAVDSGQNIVDIILGQHDLCDLNKVLGFILLHPEDFRRSKACKGNVSSHG